jgi:site-specific recombinase XerC
LKAGSIARRVSAISQAYQAAGVDSPTVKASVKLTLGGIRRALGTRQEGKAAVLTVDLSKMLSHAPKGLLGNRDRALMLVGFAGAFRRSELVGLNVEDLTITPNGAKVTIRRSKTDQEGTGQTIGIARGVTAAAPRWSAQAAARMDGTAPYPPAIAAALTALCPF